MTTISMLIVLVSNLLVGAQPRLSTQEYNAKQQKTNQAVATSDATQLEIIVDELQH